MKRLIEIIENDKNSADIANRILSISDVHYPFNKPLDIFKGYVGKVDTLQLNGDILDCYSISKYSKSFRVSPIEEMIGARQYVIDLVHSYDKYDYTKYVTFTKANTKNQLVLKSSFKYEDWKTSFTNVCEELSKTYADSAYAKMVNETIIPSLPSTFVFNYSLYIADKGKGAISGADFEFVIKGQAKIPSEISTLADSSIIAMLAGGTLTYDVSLKGNFNLSFILSTIFL